MSNLDTFYNKKRNFPDAEEREFDDLSPIPATLYHVGALVDGIGGVSTIKGRHGIRLTCRLLPPKEGDVGEIRAILSKTRRELGRFRLEPGCQLICYGRTFKVLAWFFLLIYLSSALPILYTSRILQFLSSTLSGVVDLICGMLLVQWIGCVVEMDVR